MKRSQAFWLKVKRSGECWEWGGGKDRDGYGRFWDGTATRRAHRVCWLFTHGAIPPGLFVCHRCDNPACVRPGHLFLGTPLSNNRDAAMKGRKPRVFRNSRRIAEPSVQAIRDRAAAGESQRQLARQFAVSQSYVSMVVSRRRRSIP